MTLKNHTLATSKPAGKFDVLEGLNDEALLELRYEIDKRLKTDISKLNLADELGLQYRAGTILLASVQSDSTVPANQRSQVFNAVGSMLDKIMKQMKIAFSAERLKRFEVALVKVLEQLPEDSRRTFFDLYSEFLLDDEAAAKEATTEEEAT